jgi:hypothetical protein
MEKNKSDYCGASISLLLPGLSLAQLDPPPKRVPSHIFDPSFEFSGAYIMFCGAIVPLEKAQEILSPLRSPEELTVKTAECGSLIPSASERISSRQSPFATSFEAHFGLLIK